MFHWQSVLYKSSDIISYVGLFYGSLGEQRTLISLCSLCLGVRAAEAVLSSPVVCFPQYRLEWNQETEEYDSLLVPEGPLGGGGDDDLSLRSYSYVCVFVCARHSHVFPIVVYPGLALRNLSEHNAFFLNRDN